MFEFKLPDIGEGVTEGELVKWLVKEGDSIRKEQEMVEIMTDKVTVKISSPVEGKVSKLLFQEGKVVKVGEVLIQIDDGKTEVSTNMQVSGTESPPRKQETPVPQQVSQPAERKAEAVVEMKDEEHRSISKVLASPAIRKLARDLGVDISRIRGTGPNGRLLEEDVKRYANMKNQRPQVQKEAPQPASRVVTEAAAPEPTQPAVLNSDTIELRGLRRIIFEKMTKSKQIMPHFTIFESIDMTGLNNLRDSLKAKGTSTGYTALFVKACSVVLKEFPKFNAVYNESSRNYTMKHYYNIGVAVDTPDGLTVVVVKDADKKDIQTLSADIQTLAEKARKNSLSLSEVQNSTFTVSNVGSIAGIASTPIINYPEVAILGVHRVETAVDANNRQYSRMYISMSCDHRLIDGADAARFVARLKQILEAPEQLVR